MKKKIVTLFTAFSLCFLLVGCGEDPKLTKFQEDINSFCNEIVEIDAAINNIDAEAETATTELLNHLDRLDAAFLKLAEMEVPEEYSYMEKLADEASSYMTTAVEAYHEAFSNSSYNEYTADYAKKNYERAYRRVTIILKLLRGEEISDADISVEEIEE